MKRPIKLFILFLLCFALKLGAYSASTDSIIKQIVNEGVSKLRAQQIENEKHIKDGDYSKLNFVIYIGTQNNNLINYQVATAARKFVDDPIKEQELNQRLQTIYSTKQKQCYLLLISYFDVVINTEVPNGLGVEDLFLTGKWYNENSSIVEDKQIHKLVTNEIWNANVIDKSIPFYLASVGEYIGSFRKNEFLSYYYWGLKKNEPVNLTLPSDFNSTYDYIFNYFKNGDFKAESSAIKAEKFVAAFENSVNNAELKAQILSTYTKPAMYNLLSNFKLADYYILSNAERRHILSLYVDDALTPLFHSEQIVNVVKTVAGDSVQTFLNHLKTFSVLNNNVNFSGNKNNTNALIYRLYDKLTGDDLKNFLIGIKNIISGSSYFDELLSQMIDDTNFENRVMNWGIGQTPSIRIEENTVTLKTDGGVELNQQYYNLACDTVPKGSPPTEIDIICYDDWVSSPNKITLQPFDLVNFTNYAQVSAIDDASQGGTGQLTIVPAIYIKYAKDKQTLHNITNNTLEVINYAVDGISLVSGVGAIANAGYKALSWGRKAWLLYNTIGAAVNIGVNMSDIGNDTTFSNALTIYNTINAAGGLSELSYNLAKTNYKGALKAIKGNVNAFGTASKQQYKNLLATVDRLAIKLKNNALTLNPAGIKKYKLLKAYSDKLKRNWYKLFKEPLPAGIVNGGGYLAKSLTGFLKSSYDDLLANGFSALEDAGKIKFLDNSGRHLAEISNGKLVFKYGGFGGDIVISEGKATTALGKFAEDWSNPNSYGTRYFLGSNASPVVKGFPNGSINRGVSQAVPNRLNFLDLPEPQYNALINSNIKSELEIFLGSSSNINITSQSINDVKKLIKSNHPNLTTTQIDNIVEAGQIKGNNAFWDNYNLPFLEESFQRGDDIRLVSDPINALTRTGTYKKELEAIENTLALKYNYSYNSATKTYFKN